MAAIAEIESAQIDVARQIGTASERLAMLRLTMLKAAKVDLQAEVIRLSNLIVIGTELIRTLRNIHRLQGQTLQAVRDGRIDMVVTPLKRAIERREFLIEAISEMAAA